MTSDASATTEVHPTRAPGVGTSNWYLRAAAGAGPRPVVVTRAVAAILGHSAELERRLGRVGPEGARLGPASLLVGLLTCPSRVRTEIRRFFSERQLDCLALCDALQLPVSALAGRGEVPSIVPARISEIPLEGLALEAAWTRARSIGGAHGAAPVIDAPILAFSLLSLDDADGNELMRSLGADRAGWLRSLTAALMDDQPDRAKEWRTAFEIELPDHPGPLPTADALRRRAARGEPPAASELRALMMRHGRRLLRAARAIVTDDERAEEVLVASWARMLPHFGDLTAEDGTLLELTRRVIAEALPEASPVDEQDDSPRGAAAGDRGAIQLEAAFDRLPVELRLAVMLRTVEGMTAAQVARCLGVAEAEVGRRLRQGRRQLQLGASLEQALAVDAALVSAFDLDEDGRHRIADAVAACLTRPASGIRRASGQEIVDDHGASAKAEGTPSGDSTDEASGNPPADEASSRRARRSWLPFRKRSA